MDFLAKITLLMKEKGLNRHTLSEACGIPYTTIDGWFKKGYEGIKISTLMKLADFFEVELDYLVRPSISDPNYGRKNALLNAEESDLISLYRSLNSDGRALLLTTARTITGNPAMQKNKQAAPAI